jgi:hypothetical protein
VYSDHPNDRLEAYPTIKSTARSSGRWNSFKAKIGKHLSIQGPCQLDWQVNKFEHTRELAFLPDELAGGGLCGFSF